MIWRTQKNLVATLQRVGRLRERVRRRFDRVIDTWYYRVPARAAEPWATHLPVLIALARIHKVRHVLELGAGMHSTLAFLDRAAFPDLEDVLSLETTAEWADRVQALVGTDTRLQLRVVAEPMSKSIANLGVHSYDLIFVDDSKTAEARAATIRELARCRPSTALVAIHDFENPAYRAAARGFAHHYRFAAVNPNVGIVSNAWFDRARLANVERAIARAGDRFALVDRDACCQLVDMALPHVSNVSQAGRITPK